MIISVHTKYQKEADLMDKKYNTNDDASVELKKALSKSSPRKNPNMSDAEWKLKDQGKKG